MINRFAARALLVFTFVTTLAAAPLSAAETGAGVQVPDRTKFNVLTDMTVPPECLEDGRTVCAQLAGGATRQLVYGAMCYKLQNKTSNMLFVPLRSDVEIQQFLLNVPANVVHREPCPSENN